MIGKRFTKTSAMLLVAIMAFSIVANKTYAEETAGNWAAASIVVYNIGAGEVSVGTEGMKTDYYFDESGNFAITLEENVSFPYDIEFQWGFERVTKTFDTADNAIEIGGYVFTLIAPTGEPPAAIVSADDDVTHITFSTKSEDGMLTSEDVLEQLEAAEVRRDDRFTATIDRSVLSIGYSAFHATQVTSVNILNSVSYIGYSAFGSCHSLTDVKLPDSLTRIGAYAFNECRNLESITIPNSVSIIEEWAFSGCSNLESITIPDSVIYIGVFALFSGSSLSEINVGVNNEMYSSIDGVLFDKTVTTIIRYPEGKPGEYYTIPDSVVNIESCTFIGCNNLTNILIPNSVVSIGSAAFASCINLTNIAIPNSVTSIGDSAFSNCNGLESIIIPDSVTDIGDSAFYGCSGLENIVIPDSVMRIGSNAFSNCPSLAEVDIGNGVVNMGSYVFAGTQIRTITLPPSLREFVHSSNSLGRYSAFSGMTSLDTIVFMPDSEVIPPNVFLGISRNVNVFIPKSVKEISRNSGLLGSNHIIYAFEESDAEKYAKANDIAYFTLPTILSELPEAPVGYINLPYSFKFESSDDTWISVEEEDLPEGMRLSTESDMKRDQGEIWGAPRKSGTFTVKIRALAKDGTQYPLEDETTFTIHIKGEQTQGELDELSSFNIVLPLGEHNLDEDIYIVPEFEGEAFREVEIKFDDRIDLNLDLCHPEYFIDLWLNGKLLNEYDYDVREGSVVITLRAQTFGNLDREASHVIAAEFKNKDGEQYKVAQNFRFEVTERSPEPPKTPDTPNNSPEPTKPPVLTENQTPSNRGSGNSTPQADSNRISSNDPEPLEALLESALQSQEPIGPVEPVLGNFIDIKQTDWFFDDIRWAYQNQIMIGISETEFAPNMSSSPAMIALTLARILDIDLSAYNDAGGAWYSAAMAWAESVGIFDGIIGFSPHMIMERGQLMVVIERALRLAGLNAVVTDQLIAFADAEEMTAEEFTVFQFLYKLGLVYGTDDGAMAPRRVSTRAELAAILHRIEEYVHEAEENEDKSL